MSEWLPVPQAPRALGVVAAAAAPALAGVGRHRLQPLLGRVRSIAFDCGWLAAGGGRVCCVWDVAAQSLRARRVVDGPVAAVSMARAAGHLLVGHGERVDMHHLAGAGARFGYSHAGTICSVHVAADAPVLASADRDGGVQLRSAADGRLLHALQDAPWPAIVWINAEGTLLLVETEAETRFVDVASGAVVRRFPYHDGSAAAAGGPLVDGVLVCHGGSRLFFFDCTRAAAEPTHQVELGARVLGADICNDTGLVLAALAGGRIAFFDLHGAEPFGSIESFTQPLIGARWGEGGEVLAAAGEPLVMRLVRGKHASSFYDEGPPVVAMALHADRQSLLVSDRDGGVSRFDLQRGGRQRYEGAAGSVSALACHEHWLAAGSYDGHVRAWSFAGVLLADIDLGDGPVQAVAVDPDGQRLWAGTTGGRLACFDLATQAPLASFVLRPASIRTLAFDAAGRAVAAGDDEGRWTLLALPAGQVLAQRQRSGPAYRALFTETGDLLTASFDGVYRDTPGTAASRLYPGRDIRWFDRGGGRLCSLSLGGELSLFDEAAGTLLARTEVEGDGPHRSVLLLNPDRWLVGSGDGRVQVFDGRLQRVATLVLLRRGVFWTSADVAGAPAWYFTDRPELLALGEGEGDAFQPWPEGDPRHARHAAVYNSARHMMQRVNGAPAKAPALSLSAPGPSALVLLGRSGVP